MKHILRWSRVHARLIWESLGDALPLLFKLIAAICAIIRRLCRRSKLSERERRRSPDRCVPINDPAFKRPDPLIYSQFYLMSLGFGVSWDNPDIQLFRGGVPVPSSDLKADTDYEVIARVWNNSTEAPVARLPVRFSYLSFGAGIVSQAIGLDEVNLGVKGGPNHPAFAKATWHTPPLPGHYCIQVLLEWLDDANPRNNLGNENTNVGKLSSPASFTFTLGNPTKERLEYRFETDAYRIPPRDPCRGAEDPPVSRREAMARHNRSNFPLPNGWSVVFSPAAPALPPGAEETIAATVNAPDGFVGTQAINVHAFNRYGLAGGVTLYVEGL
jgi:hypothetical protein